MTVVGPIFVLLLISLVLWLVVYNHKQTEARKRAWVAFGENTGLAFTDEAPWRGGRFLGIHRGVPALIYFWSVSSGKSTVYYTTGLALFGLSLPKGLVVSKEGIGAALAKVFGGQDIQLDDPRLDDALRIRGEAAREVQALLRLPKVGDAVLAFVSGESCTVTEHFARSTKNGWLDRVETLEGLLTEVVEAVLRIEEGLLWHPEDDTHAARMLADPHEWFDETEPTGPPSEVPSGDRSQAEEGTASPGSAFGVEALIAELRGDTHAEAGTWTIDRAVAIEKMRRFQLEDPESYILELIQAAQLKGATAIALEITASGLHLSFDGAPFTMTDFERLYSSLVEDAAASEGSGLRELAIGLSAARSLKPRRISVRSGDAAGGAELTLWPDKDDEYARCEVDAPGTTLRIEGKLRDVFSSRSERLVDLLFEACRFSRVPITINGREVRWAPEPLWGSSVVEDEGLWGCVYFDPNAPSEILWKKHGVIIEREPMGGLLQGCVAVVESGRTRKDLSQRAMVRDEALAAARRRILGARANALSNLARDLVAGRVPDDLRGWATSVILDSALGFSPESLSPGGPAADLGGVPLWPTLAGTRLSPNEIRSMAEESPPVRFGSLEMASLMVHVPSVPAETLQALTQAPVVTWQTPTSHRAALLSLTQGQLSRLSLRSMELPVDMDALDGIMLGHSKDR